MFFSEKIKQIKSTDKVLEVGPGSLPFPRSDVYLDKKFDDLESSAQRGYAEKVKYDKPVFFYDGKKFPFRDKEFDYVICSHVLEHVPQEDLNDFISELQRVAHKGYIEFPTAFYELINYQDVHLWLMNFKNNKILFLDKKTFKSSYVHKIFREMFYCEGSDLTRLFTHYKELFFCGFEWDGKIDWEMKENLDELINENDYKLYTKYFSARQPHKFNQLTKTGSMKMNVLKNMIRNVLHGLRLVPNNNVSIHPTAELNNKKFIVLGEHVEIKEHVIIQTRQHPVKIDEYTQINPFTVIYGGNGVNIGKNVMIAPHCMIAAGNHDYKQIEKPMRFAGNLSSGPITIEDNVLICANCTITDGVTIGRDALVAANSVVTKDVAPYDIVAGVPAKVIGNRKNLSQTP